MWASASTTVRLLRERVDRRSLLDGVDVFARVAEREAIEREAMSATFRRVLRGHDTGALDRMAIGGADCR
jgi:hypothetical protein